MALRDPNEHPLNQQNEIYQGQDGRYFVHDPATGEVRIYDALGIPLQNVDGTPVIHPDVMTPQHMYMLGFGDRTYTGQTNVADPTGQTPLAPTRFLEMDPETGRMSPEVVREWIYDSPNGVRASEVDNGTLFPRGLNAEGEMTISYKTPDGNVVSVGRVNNQGQFIPDSPLTPLGSQFERIGFNMDTGGTPVFYANGQIMDLNGNSLGTYNFQPGAGANGQTLANIQINDANINFNFNPTRIETIDVVNPRQLNLRTDEGILIGKGADQSIPIVQVVGRNYDGTHNWAENTVRLFTQNADGQSLRYKFLVGKDPNGQPLNRLFRFNGQPAEMIGIMDDGFPSVMNSHMEGYYVIDPITMEPTGYVTPYNDGRSRPFIPVGNEDFPLYTGTGGGFWNKLFGQGNNVETQKPTYTDDQIRSLEYYKKDGYRQINEVLRVDGAPTRTLGQHIQNMDSMMSPLTGDMVTYRSVNLDYYPSLRDAVEEGVGATFIEPGYGSTSTEPIVAYNFYNNRSGVMLEVNIPEGTRVLDVERVLSRESEGEIILDRGGQYVIREIRVIDFGRC